MRHTQGHTEGSRDEVLAELREAAEGWLHFDRPDLAAEAESAAAAIANGEIAAQLGHVVYHVAP